MKHTIYGVALAFAAVLIIAAVMTVSGGDVRENEMDKALNTAVEQSLEQLRMEGGYEVENYQELIADFNQAILLHIASDSDLKVEVLAADVKRGVLDVQVTETYTTVKGSKKNASVRKTVILEEYSDKRRYFTITFQSEGEIYANYSLYQGSLIVMPQEPEKSGSNFKGWRENESGTLLTQEIKAEKDMVFEAMFD